MADEYDKDKELLDAATEDKYLAEGHSLPTQNAMHSQFRS